ncbi:His-Me finger endonuclease [Gigaspora margarita]|uniref:His-Me finger endonuclease n=1 Tax=Gigaspora margarita TaxID=4874 RepID=A0A8H4A755_GIGMA|nr:His-Me finger endonuclease [Gigaspora margarita]
MEVWLPVISTSDLLVSNLGRIKNKKGKHDNRAVNLEWVTSKENAERTVFRNPSKSRSRKVVQMSLDGNVVQIWDSITLASNTLSIVMSNISRCCSGRLNTAKRWRWMYYEDYIEQDSNEEWREIEINSRKFKVSSLGRVRLPNGLITKGFLDAGYFRVAREKYRVHRLVALAFCLKEKGKEYVNHVDGDPSNNKASNLE